MAAWFLKSRSNLQFVKIQGGLHEIFKRSLFCGSTVLSFVTSGNVHCSHVSFLGLPGHSVRFQASQQSQAVQLEKDSDCSKNGVAYLIFVYFIPRPFFNKSSKWFLLIPMHVQSNNMNLNKGKVMLTFNKLFY